MKSQLILFILCLFFSSLSFSGGKAVQNKNEKKHDHSKSGEKHDHSQQKAVVKNVEKEKVVIKVNGMVCAFCAQGIKKNFNKRKEVKSTEVDLDTMEVTIKLKPGSKLSEEVLKEVVTGAGFSYVGVKK